MPTDESSIRQFINSMLPESYATSAEIHIGLPLSETMIQLAACSAFLSSDSGLMHLADALGVPTFGLFGPTHPALGFAPAGEKSFAFHAGTWCSPCHRHGSAPCFRDRRYCFSEMDTESIARTVTTTINSARAVRS
jgi:ADP-heptose:LPS heptosyltransferase